MKNENAYLSLSDIQELIGKTIRESFVEQYWVTAEISEMKINYSGHCYLELIEKKDEKEEITARVRGIIWSRQARFLLPYFETTTGNPLSEGMKILARVTVEYHKLYGMSLVISDIDPAYTIGEMAISRAMILKRLGDEGIIGMNRGLSFPSFPQRVAVVSSDKAAGYSDFKDHLTANSHGYSFKITLFPAVMQGKETSASVRLALNRIYENITDFDIVAIVRGGGSQADLSWFDDYDIAYLITQFPLPVITGIGHEKDVSVCDIVAFSSMKTPTAVADFIIERTSGSEEYLDSLGRNISGRAAIIISDSANRLEYLVKTLVPAQRRYIDNLFSRVSQLKDSIKPATKKLIATFDERIHYIERSARYLSPDSVLKRGYSISRVNGKVIKDSGEVSKGDTVLTVLHKGSFESEVFDIK